MSSLPLYALRSVEVYPAMDASPDGLSPEECAARLSLYGPNVLREPPPQPIWRRLVGYLTHSMALLLWGAGLVAILGNRLGMGIIIWVVVLINAAFSFWREYRAERAVRTLKNLLPAYARVLRSGAETKVLASDVVPGDVLVLAEGDNVPADARVVEEYGLRTNDSTLTGEAMPVRKTGDASLREGLSELERPNMVFAGTSIFAGTGRAVVVSTGMTTQFGRIANLTENVHEEPSLLQNSLLRMTRILSIVAFTAGAIVFVIELFEVGVQLIDALLFAVGVIVATVPEGLIPTVTLSLSMAVQRLANKGVLVKKLAIVETLGTTSVICTDKSGTLTQNQMTVREIWVGGNRIDVTGVGYDPTVGKLNANGSVNPEDLKSLLVAASLCNNSRVNAPSVDRPIWTCLGDQTEAALRVMARKGTIDESDIAQTYPRVHELPFDARRKRMTTIHRNASGDIAFVKGAPREVLQLCTHIMRNGEVIPLDRALRAEVMAANDEYARNALRVLALARRTLPARSGTYSPERVEQELTFLGLAAMMDPPRADVSEAIRSCREAGIRMVMITGDYGLTAESVARRIGMLTPSANPHILTGADVDSLSDAELQAMLVDEVVCARMAPEHKLRLVSAFQACGNVVAVIGDGVNDAPALRKADIGIAMGVTGTDVAKEAADVVLTNDNFGGIVAAVEEGRAVYDNLRKFVSYIFASNVPELLPFIISSLFKLPLALTIMQILAIDLGTDIFPAMALSIEKPEPGVMLKPPRKRDQPLLDRALLLRAIFFVGVIQTVLCYAAFFFVYSQAGFSDLLHLPRVDNLPFFERLMGPEGRVYILATTVFHAGVVFSQIGNALASRAFTSRTRDIGLFSNHSLLLAIIAELIIILTLIYAPPFNALFEHLPLPPIYLLGLASFAPIVFGLEWIRKAIARRLRKPETRPAAS
ncbi:MAG: cation-transporting P-type ATPase [Chloroflexi bacterium]|nr:cation-transporting P-type ATPase [Chloroflexota bacterium]MCL5275713.1 cation-transporting P-type ATPase [Chloroflexota bacterium]